MAASSTQEPKQESIVGANIIVGTPGKLCATFAEFTPRAFRDFEMLILGILWRFLLLLDSMDLRKRERERETDSTLKFIKIE